MKNIFSFANGWKSYIVAFVGVVGNGLVAMGYIDAATMVTVNKILAFLGLATVKSAIKKAE